MKVLPYLFAVKKHPLSILHIKKYFNALLCDQLLSQIVFLLLLPSQKKVLGKIFIYSLWYSDK